LSFCEATFFLIIVFEFEGESANRFREEQLRKPIDCHGSQMVLIRIVLEAYYFESRSILSICWLCGYS
jgi:hypothetical protein